jgi:hypothetical protein
MGAIDSPFKGASTDVYNMLSYYVASPSNGNKLQKFGDIISTMKSP